MPACTQPISVATPWEHTAHANCVHCTICRCDDVCCIDNAAEVAGEASLWLQQAAARSADTSSNVAYIRRLSVDPDAEVCFVLNTSACGAANTHMSCGGRCCLDASNFYSASQTCVACCFQAAATEALIKETFLALYHVNSIMLATSWEIGLQQAGKQQAWSSYRPQQEHQLNGKQLAGLAALFDKVATNPSHHLWLYQCRRAACLIPLAIRR
jgi:hypothetical protein